MVGGLATKYVLFKTVDHRQKERHSPVQGWNQPRSGAAYP